MCFCHHRTSDDTKLCYTYLHQEYLWYSTREYALGNSNLHVAEFCLCSGELDWNVYNIQYTICNIHTTFSFLLPRDLYTMQYSPKIRSDMHFIDLFKKLLTCCKKWSRVKQYKQRCNIQVECRFDDIRLEQVASLGLFRDEFCNKALFDWHSIRWKRKA